MTLRQTQLDLLRRLVDTSNSLAHNGVSYEFVVSSTLAGTDAIFLWSRDAAGIDGISTSDINELRSRAFLRLTRSGRHGDRNYEVTSKAFETFREEVVLEYAADSMFKTGDDRLDELLESAVTRHKLADTRAHRDAIEKLWDAWERIKTLEPPGSDDKKASTTALLDLAAQEPSFRELLETEAIALRDIGNGYCIRHHETGKTSLDDPAQVDYFFERLLAMIRLVLRKSGRM